MNRPDWETVCDASPDRKHCAHWYDDGPCCYCHDEGGGSEEGGT